MDEKFVKQTELGVLWVKESKGGQMYFTGKFHLPNGKEVEIVVLPIRNPEGQRYIPQFRIVKSFYVKSTTRKVPIEESRTGQTKERVDPVRS